MQSCSLKKVAITGASGFLGRNLIPALLDIAEEVIAISSKNRDELLEVCGIGVNPTEFIVLNNTDIEGIKREIQNADRLINCAFPRGKDGKAYAQGLRFIADVFKIANDSNVEAVINISSQSVYSQYRTKPATEETPVCLETKYAVAKYATELLVEAYCQNCYYTNIRLASLIGPGFDQRVVNKLVYKVLTGETLYIKENSSLYGYLDVRDAAKAVSDLCCNSSISKLSDVYNVGSYRAYSLTEIAECILSCMQQQYSESLLPSIRIEKVDQLSTNSMISSANFMKLTGWSQEFMLEDTVNSILNRSKI